MTTPERQDVPAPVQAPPAATPAFGDGLQVPAGGTALLGTLTTDHVLALQRTSGNRSVTRLLRLATEQASAPPVQSTDRISALVDQYHATRDEKERVALVRQILTEVERVAAAPGTDPGVRVLLARDAGELKRALEEPGDSPMKQAGMAAGGVIVVGGGPEDVPADAIALIVFLAVLFTVAQKSKTPVDPAQVAEALDRIKNALRKPERKPQQKPDPDKRPPPLGPDVIPEPKDDQRPLHMGNIHVQGDDIPGGAYNYAWSQPMPETKAQGQAGLAQVRAQCTPRQLKDRDDAFKRAAKFIDSTLTQAPPLVFRTFQNRDVADDPKRKTRRVDIEITRGTAFA